MEHYSVLQVAGKLNQPNPSLGGLISKAAESRKGNRLPLVENG